MNELCFLRVRGGNGSVEAVSARFVDAEHDRHDSSHLRSHESRCCFRQSHFGIILHLPCFALSSSWISIVFSKSFLYVPAHWSHLNSGVWINHGDDYLIGSKNVIVSCGRRDGDHTQEWRSRREAAHDAHLFRTQLHWISSWSHLNHWRFLVALLWSIPLQIILLNFPLHWNRLTYSILST